MYYFNIRVLPIMGSSRFLPCAALTIPMIASTVNTSPTRLSNNDPMKASRQEITVNIADTIPHTMLNATQAMASTSP